MGLATIVPIWQFHAALAGGGTSYMLSQNANAPQGWTQDGIAFYAFKTPEGGGVPVYQYHTALSNGTSYTYSTNPSLGSNWIRDGVAWCAFDVSTPGAIPIYQYVFSQPGLSLYAFSSSSDFGPGWANIGPAFYALSQEKAVAPDYGLMLDGTSYVTMPYIEAYNFAQTDFSVTAMFQTGGPGTVVSRKSPHGGSRSLGGWLVAIEQGGIIVFATDNGHASFVVQSEETEALDDQWHGVAIVRRKGDLEIWLDGVQLSTTQRGTGYTPLTLSSQTPLMIGGTTKIEQYYASFEGLIEDVTLWNFAISAGQITEAMFNLLTGQEQGLIGFWKMDNSLADSSPQNNEGAANGNVSFVPVFHATWVEGAPNAFSFATVSNLVVGQTIGTTITNKQTLSVAAGAPYLVACVMDPAAVKFPAGVWLTIWDPLGNIYNQAQNTQTLCVAMSGASIWYMVVVEPMAGEWTAQISATVSVPFVFCFHTLPSADLVQTMTNALAPVYGLNPGGKRAKHSLVARAEQEAGGSQSSLAGTVYIIGAIGLGALAFIAVSSAGGALFAPPLMIASGLLLQAGEAELWISGASQAKLKPTQAAHQAATTAGFTANGKPIRPSPAEVYASVINTVGQTESQPATTNPANFASRTTMGVGVDYFLHLDVWGEGPFEFDNIPSGFEDALNVNARETFSQPPHPSIPMLVRVANWDVKQFPFADGTFNYITMQGAPLTSNTAREIVRMLAPGGRVGLWISWGARELATANDLANALNSTLEFSCAGTAGTPGGVSCYPFCIDETNGEYGITKGCIVDGRKKS